MIEQTTKCCLLLAIALAGTVSVTLSVPLQAPSVMLIGLAALLSCCTCLFTQGTVYTGKVLLSIAVLACVYFSIRAFTSPVWDLGVQDLMLILPVGIVYLIGGYGVRGEDGILLRRGIAKTVILLLVLNTASAVSQLFGSSGFSGSWYFTSSRPATGDHITGMYGYYGSFANFMVVSGLLCLSLGAWGRASRSLRIAFLAIGVVALGLAVWSRSRSAAVSLVIALIVFVVLLYNSLSDHSETIKTKVRRILVFVGGIGVVAAIVGGAWVLNNRAINESEKIQGAMFDSDVRMSFWAMAVEQWQDYPMVGAGSRSFSYLANHYWSPSLSTGEASPEFVHNEYLQLLADYGIVGLALVALLGGWHVALGVKRIKSLSLKSGERGIMHGSNEVALALAGVCGMIAMAVHIIFDFRTHLLPNIIMLTCCAIWVLPVLKKSYDSSAQSTINRGANKVLAVCLIALGIGAIYLGCIQFVGGLPLLEKRIAKEDGAWSASKVSRQKWIPVLEESTKRMPQYLRYQRLGMLYVTEAHQVEGEARNNLLNKAKQALLNSTKRHAYNPQPWIDLAGIYTWEQNYELADNAFQSASEMAKARERWYRMHSHWAAMHQQWGDKNRLSKNTKLAHDHYSRAQQLFLESCKYGDLYENKEWVVAYTQLLVVRARLFDSEKKFEEAEALFEEGRRQVDWGNRQRETKMNYYYAKHLYEKGWHVWHQRQPEQAYRILMKSKAQLEEHKRLMKGAVEEGYADQLAKVDKVLKFFNNAGFGAEK